MKYKLTRFNRYVTDSELLGDLKRVAKLTKKQTVTRADYEKFGVFARSTVMHRFGGWNAALKLCGFKLNKNKQVSKGELFLNIKKVWVILKRQPKRNEMNLGISEFSWNVYRYRFGSFSSALEEFIKFINKNRVHKTKSIYPKQVKRKVKQNGRREVGLRLRYLVLERDSYRCVLCGRSPAFIPGVSLEVDHIKPWSKGGKSAMSNLQTLCRECNIGKGNS